MDDSPYKFLDYYEFNKDNPEPFFGRQSETQILLSDILVSRLVVLFAQTGTGKTSLINAGVRPLLEKRDYKHVFIRTRNDPAESARAELSAYLEVERLDGDTLPDQLEWAQQQVTRPLVLFFDQFEEFFLQAPSRDSKQRMRQFVLDIAELYESSDNGVHIVFSMREEWFVKMDLFREHIPELFQNESSLRLRFFHPPQAREAMVGPAELRGVQIEEDLIGEVISDLTNDDNEIEPAQLQIICDSLWRNKADETRITGDDYRRLGLKYAPTRKRPGTTISQNVLTGRLVDDFEELTSASQLNLLSRLLPHLATEADTKSFRDLESLAAGLEVSKDELKSLAEYLENSGLIRTLDRGDLTFIELAHDYLAHRHRLRDLEDRVKAIWPRNLLDKAIGVYEAAKRSGRAADIQALSDSGEDRLSLENLQTITENVATSDYSAGELDFLLRWALSSGVESQVQTWFEEASTGGVDVWRTLDEVVSEREFSEGAEKVIYLLRRLHDNRKWPLLAKAIGRDDLTFTAIDVLGKMREPESVELLKTALSGKCRDDAIEALGRLRTMSALETLGELLQRGEAIELTLAVLEKVSKRREDAIAVEARSIVQRWKPVDEVRRSAVADRAPDYYPTRSEKDHKRAFDEREFDILLERIVQGRCLPIIGAGINSADVPQLSQIAQSWAMKYDYPFAEASNFPKVAQYLSVHYDYAFLRELIADEYRKYKLPVESNERLAATASLPFPVYITTNYDSFLQQQLIRLHRQPVVDYCRWDKSISGPTSSAEDYRPTASEPLVYHLHGITSEPESLVLTEEDYFTHLVNLSRDPRIVPNVVGAALNRSSLLLLGVDASSWEFRLLLSLLTPMLQRSLSRLHVCVQLPPAQTRYQETFMKYYDLYFRAHQIRIYWASIDDFVSQLLHRWTSSHGS
jgi:hypothetical protein